MKSNTNNILERQTSILVTAEYNDLINLQSTLQKLMLIAMPELWIDSQGNW